MIRSLAVLLLCCLLVACGGLRIDDSHVSANQDSRARYVVIHYTSTDFAHSLDLLTHGEVSSHYLIDRRPARIYRLVDENRRAWHAGESYWQGRTWLNASSIGIELVSPGYRLDAQGRRLWYPYPDEQIDQLILLLKDIVKRHGLGPDAIIGHSDIAPQRKVDPGPLFPWKRLADAGLIRWPNAAAVAAAQAGFAQALPDAAWFQSQLAAFGYEVPTSGVFDEATRKVIGAFQMRYRPSRFDGTPDAETAALLLVVNGQRERATAQ